MTVKARTYSLELEISEEMFGELEDQSWEEGFDKIEDLVRCVINRYLRSTDALDIQDEIQRPDRSMIELDSMLFYSRLLTVIEAGCKSLEFKIRWLFVILDNAYIKLVTQKYCATNLTLGQVLREARSNFSSQATNHEVYIVYQCLQKQYPEHRDLIQKEINNI